MRSYRQYCGLAKALDVVGDRWTLLIVRELLIRGSCRYTDLQAGLPGIATNLLASRLRELEGAGLIVREGPRPPIATPLFRLTPRGESLQGALLELGRWGAPLLAKSGSKDVMKTHWLVLPARMHLRDTTPGRPSVTLEVLCGEDALAVTASGGEVRVEAGPAREPDATIAGPAPLVLQVLAGKMTLKSARSAGLDYRGDPGTLGRLQPLALGIGE